MSVSSLPASLKAGEHSEEATYLQLDEVAMLKAQDKKPQSTNRPRSIPKIRSADPSSYENPDDPIYVKFPVTEPPTPPPRDQEFKFTGVVQRAASHYGGRFSRPSQLSVIDEKEEGVKSPGQLTPRNQRTTQSLRSPRRSDASLLELPPSTRRPSLDRQRSRGDILISEVVSSVKAKVRQRTYPQVSDFVRTILQMMSTHTQCTHTSVLRCVARSKAWHAHISLNRYSSHWYGKRKLLSIDCVFSKHSVPTAQTTFVRGRPTSVFVVLHKRMCENISHTNNNPFTVVLFQTPGDLTVKKGELVKVTNSALDRKLCVAVRTNGESGTIKKKNLEHVVPGKKS